MRKKISSALLRLAAQVVQSERTLQDTKVHWTKVFDSAVKAFAGTLELFRPLQAEGFLVGSPEMHHGMERSTACRTAGSPRTSSRPPSALPVCSAP
jgi:hypothetical protein